ncbi:MAG: DMT family transporter, partial [Spirochaetaceae bacterium]|nr:DMT family transporter [Spirochaetaceae bacterium]
MARNFTGFLAGTSLVCATLLWGGGFVAVKNSLDFVPPIYMIALRFLAASILLSIIFFKQFKYITWTTVYRSFILSTFLFLAYVFQTVGILSTTAGKNAFLTTVYVILVPFIAWFFSRRNPGLHVF